MIRGIDAARAAGFSPALKLNTVVVRGYNDDELADLVRFAADHDAEMRFIEYMDVGGASQWSSARVMPEGEIIGALAAAFGAPEPERRGPTRHAPAARWRFPDVGDVGVIASTTAPFCRDCDRARLTADGQLFICLYGTAGHDLREIVRAGASQQTLSSRSPGSGRSAAIAGQRSGLRCPSAGPWCHWATSGPIDIARCTSSAGSAARTSPGARPRAGVAPVRLAAYVFAPQPLTPTDVMAFHVALLEARSTRRDRRGRHGAAPAPTRRCTWSARSDSGPRRRHCAAPAPMTGTRSTGGCIPGWRDFRDAMSRERCLYFAADGERDPAEAPFRAQLGAGLRRRDRAACRSGFARSIPIDSSSCRRRAVARHRVPADAVSAVLEIAAQARHRRSCTRRATPPSASLSAWVTRWPGITLHGRSD